MHLYTVPHVTHIYTMLNTNCITILVLLPEGKGMYIKTHTYTYKQNYKRG